MKISFNSFIFLTSGSGYVNRNFKVVKSCLFFRLRLRTEAIVITLGFNGLNTKSLCAWLSLIMTDFLLLCLLSKLSKPLLIFLRFKILLSTISRVCFLTPVSFIDWYNSICNHLSVYLNLVLETVLPDESIVSFSLDAIFFLLISTREIRLQRNHNTWNLFFSDLENSMKSNINISISVR